MSFADPNSIWKSSIVPLDEILEMEVYLKKIAGN